MRTLARIEKRTNGYAVVRLYGPTKHFERFLDARRELGNTIRKTEKLVARQRAIWGTA